MKLSAVCIQRPVFAWVMTIVVILLGIVGFTRLPVQQFPTFEHPSITIETQLRGAGPEIIETQITKLIEDALAGLEGLESISSRSAQEDSKVFVTFKASRRIDDATNDIRDRLSRLTMPPEATQPRLIKSKTDERPIMILAVTSTKRNPNELADIAHYDLKKEFESVPGISKVDISGAGLYNMHIQLDPVKLSAHGLMVTDVMNALKRQNIEKPSGRLVSFDREYQVTVLANLEKPEQFANVGVRSQNGHLIHLRDLITPNGIFESAESEKQFTRFNGENSINIALLKQGVANPMDISKKVQETIQKLSDRIPSDVKISVALDQSQFIKKSIGHVYSALFEAIILVVLVVFAFLRSARASLIPLVTIPVSLIGSFFLMYMLNFSINIITLMAMVLAIGLVVDDAIVVLENIYRYIEKGMNPFKAAFEGIKEISFAVIAMTLTLAAVYAPITLAQGMTGKLFTEFAVTLAGSVILSGFAALTLSPMMCARLLGPSTVTFDWWEKCKRYLPSEKQLEELDNTYAMVLQKVLQKRVRLILSGVGFFVFGILLFFMLPKQTSPKEDRGVLQISGQADQSATLDFTKKYVQQLDDFLATIPDIKSRIIDIKKPSYDIEVNLKDDRTMSTNQIRKMIEKEILKLPGINGTVEESSGSSVGGVPSISWAILGNKDYKELKTYGSLLSNTLYGNGSFPPRNILSSRSGEVLNFIVTVNRDKASNLEIDPYTIAETLGALIRGQKVGEYNRENRRYDVRVEVRDEARQNPNDISNLFINVGDRYRRNQNREGGLVPLSELIEVTPQATLPEIFRMNLERAYTMRGILPMGTSMSTAIESVQKAGKDVLPEGMHIEFIGETKRFLEEQGNIVFVFLLALAFIYLVLAAQFESWRDPFIIMLSVPLSLSGAILTLFLIKDGSINLYSQIGLVTLIGLITKHGILMVDFANQLQLGGRDKYDSIIESCRMRLRPILMTTLAMVLGSLPLALSSGAGAESRRQIGWVIVGGMSIGTLFTLFVLPAVYLYLSKVRKPIVLED